MSSSTTHACRPCSPRGGISASPRKPLDNHGKCRQPLCGGTKLMWRDGTNSSRGLPVCSQKENLPALDWWHATQYSEGWRRSGATGSGDTDLAANNTSGLTSHRHWCDDSLICQVTPKTLEKKVTGRASRPGLRPPSAATSHHPRNCNVRCYHAKRHLR